MALKYFMVLILLFFDFNGGVSVKNEKTGATELCMVKYLMHSELGYRYDSILSVRSQNITRWQSPLEFLKRNNVRLFAR